MRFTAVFLLFMLLFPLPLPPYEGELDALSAFSDPARIWGNGVEALIEEAYRVCFKTYIIGERVMNLRMPFAQNNERDKLSDRGWEFLGGGKGDPLRLWAVIGDILGSEDFTEYTKLLSDGRGKVIFFDIPGRTWTASGDLFDLARMRAGSYGGLPHRPQVLVSGRGIEETDVYNYLYCTGWVGMDCSGFVWHVLSHIARSGGMDLGRTLGFIPRITGEGEAVYSVGTWFFNGGHGEFRGVIDEVEKLRPADILLFRGADGEMAHSAIIQSIDFSAGSIRYLQCTDEAPPAERGVHDSFIHFDPRRRKARLGDPSLIWTQSRYPPFAGERPSPFSDDGQRWRAFGGGRVVRLRTLEGIIHRINRR